MTIQIVSANEIAIWKDILGRFEKIDVCHLPEYHLAYSSQQLGSKALLWHYKDGRSEFCYPFILTPVVDCQNQLHTIFSEYYDISSVYGYTGPLGKNINQDFVKDAWRAFDDWAKQQKIVVEFIRFSPYCQNIALAHHDMHVEHNRMLAVSELPASAPALLKALGAKTRNMLRKASKYDLSCRELELKEWLPNFQILYIDSMRKNRAADFFYYNQEYFNYMLKMPSNVLRLFGVFHDSIMVAASMIIVHQCAALYHLGVSLDEYARLGAGNLSLWTASEVLLKEGVKYFNLGGGRSTDENEPLLRFKKSNSTGVTAFHVGKRVLDYDVYIEMIEDFKKKMPERLDLSKIIFYR